ncbi:post-transcriptional regulator [Bacillus piscicola]|uniref:post-transcriptional regulator n=1 Tax=Bacillus piscicola TaxID=1632684 RepID=UPI001F088828|nr:post-transcriptional regulator [Bacillus piscicola]
MTQQFEVWKADAEPALVSKWEEFRLLGYTQATKEEIWLCVLEKLHKRGEPVRLHALINTILSLRLSEFMTRITVQSYQESHYSDSSTLDHLIGEIDAHVSNKRHLT